MNKSSYFIEKKGFTLIELLIVIAIIANLSGVVLVSTQSARLKASDSAALTTGMSVAAAILSCDLAGGKVVIPAVGGNICNRGALYGTDPQLPSGWSYSSSIWTGGDADLIYASSSYDGGHYMYCGHYPDWNIHCGTPGYVGLCRGSTGFSCAFTADGGVTFK